MWHWHGCFLDVGEDRCSMYPAVVYGLLFDDAVSEAFKKEIGTSGVTVQVIVVAVMLVLVGVLFIVIENWNKNRVPTTTTLSQLTYRDALIIGFCQLVAAALPGTSRPELRSWVLL